MGEMDKIFEQLNSELAEARKRIDELDLSLASVEKTPSVGYDTLRTFFDSATDSFSIWDSNLNMIYLNDATLEKYYPAGTKREDIIGRHFTELVPGCVESGRYARYLNVLKTGIPVYIEDFQPHPRFGDMYLTIRVFKIENGLGIITIDNTERKRIEQALRNNEERLRVLIENAPDIILSYDTNGRFISGNKKAEELLGYKLEEKLGKTFDESGIFTTESLTKAKQRLENYKQGKETESIPYELIAKDGSHLFLEVRGVPVVSGDNTEVIAIARDITERRKMENALRHSEEKLRAIFDSIGDSVTVVDGDGKIIELNDAAVRLFGCKSKDEALGMYGLTFIVEEDRPPVIETTPVRCVRYKFRRMDGTTFWGETSSDILRDDSGAVTGFIGIVRDITERRKTEDALRQSEEKFRVIFNSIGDGISVIDLTTGKLIDTNEAALRMFNYTREDVIGMNAYELIAEKDRQRAMEDMVNTLQTGDSGLAEWCLLGKGGTEHDCEARASVIRDASWNPLYLVNVVRDISKRKELEGKLRESEEKIRQVFNSVGVGITVTDMEGKVVEINDIGLRLCGYKKNELLGNNGINLIAEKDRPRIINAMTAAFQTGKSSLQEFTALKKDGVEYDVEAIATILSDVSGESTGMIISITDISERKRIEGELNDYKENLERMVEIRTRELSDAYAELKHNEAALKESEEKYRTLVEQLPQGIVIMQDNRIVFANDAMSRINGYSVKEMLSMSPENVVNIAHSGSRDDLAKRIDERMKGILVPQHSEWRIVRKDGQEKWLDAQAMRIIFNGKFAVQATLTDITERKRIENALRNSEEKLRTMFTSMADGVIVTDMEGNFRDANLSALNMFGYRSKEDVRDANGFDFIADSDRETAMKDMARLFDEGLVTGRSWRFKHSSGREFQAELSTALIKDTEGNPTDILVVMRDITERRRMEGALKESEIKYRTLVEQSEQGICILQDGRIMFANSALAKINGYTFKEMYAMDAKELLKTVHPEDRESYVERVQRRLRGDKMMPRHEYRIIRKNGAERTLETYTKLISYQGKPAIQSTIADITERKQWEAQLKESREELRFYLNQLTKAQEEERKKIARELHDETIQELITLSRQLDDLIDKKIKPDEDRRGSRQKIEAARHKVDAILKGVRQFTRDLRPSVLDDLGLVPALEWLSSDMSNRFNIPIDTSVIGKEQHLSPDAALAIFRVAQESLGNAGRHAEASQIHVNLKFTRRTATLSIIDNGRGFTPPKQTSKLTKLGKLGVAGMYERAQLIGATLSIKSKRNKGTIVSLEVPLK